MKRFLYTISLLLCFLSAFSQTENTMYLLDNVYQASYINPTATPQNTVSIGLPGISSLQAYGMVDHFTLQNIGTEQNGKLIIDEDKIAQNSKLTNKNYINLGTAVDLFSLRVKVNSNFWSFNITDKTNFSYRYPKQLLDLAAEGNAQYEGKTADFSTLAVNGVMYREMGLSFLHIGEKINWSIKPKLLFGMANVRSDIKEIKYSIEKDISVDGDYIYKHTGKIDGTIYTSGIDTNEVDGKTIVKQYISPKNLGFAVDLGATYKVNDKFEISGSIIDLGFIQWQEKVINYHFKGDTSYTGIDVADQLILNENENINPNLDSISGKYKYSTSSEKYNTALNYKINLSARYKFARSTYANVLLHFNNYAGFRPSLSIGVYHEVKRIFNIAVTNSIQNSSYLNLGLGFAANLGPIQLYAAADKIDGLFNLAKVDGAVIPYNQNYFTLRFGINLVFGKILSQEKMPLNYE